MHAWELVGEKRLKAPSGFMRLLTRTYLLPDGRETSWDVLDGGLTVAVLALTTDRQVVLARQFRPGPGLVLDEMPGGYVEDGENAIEAGGRELLEETGYVGDLQLVGSTWLSASATTRRHVVVARDCVLRDEPHTDGDEFTEVVLVTLEEFRVRLRSGAMTDVDLGYQGLDYLQLL